MRYDSQSTRSVVSKYLSRLFIVVRLILRCTSFASVFLQTSSTLFVQIYERSIGKIKGLARLLVFEKLKNDRMRASFLRERRQLRDRPRSAYKFIRQKYKGDLKQKDDKMDLEANNYDVGPLHIPYGPRWDARRIDKLVYQTVSHIFIGDARHFSCGQSGFRNELYGNLIHYAEDTINPL
jgi:hypothetical protein